MQDDLQVLAAVTSLPPRPDLREDLDVVHEGQHDDAPHQVLSRYDKEGFPKNFS